MQDVIADSNDPISLNIKGVLIGKQVLKGSLAEERKAFEDAVNLRFWPALVNLGRTYDRYGDKDGAI